MKYLLITFALSFSIPTKMKVIYDFTTESKVSEWRPVNDGVMGGISKSNLMLTEEGHGQFSGHVSLENNGGFASIQFNTSIKIADDKKLIVLSVKGDGKAYEFRLKGEVSQAESYVHQFQTTGDWQIIRLPINDFYPQFRGRKLNIPNFNFQNIEQVSFLIANKKEEDFKLLIDIIGVE